MQTQRFGGSVNQDRGRSIRPTWSANLTREILFRRLLVSAAAPTPVPAPVPKPPAVERLLQRLVTETACSGSSVRTGGIGDVAQISACGAAGSGATASTGILPA